MTFLLVELSHVALIMTLYGTCFFSHWKFFPSHFVKETAVHVAVDINVLLSFQVACGYDLSEDNLFNVTGLQRLINIFKHVSSGGFRQIVFCDEDE